MSALIKKAMSSQNSQIHRRLISVVESVINKYDVIYHITCDM